MDRPSSVKSAVFPLPRIRKDAGQRYAFLVGKGTQNLRVFSFRIVNMYSAKVLDHFHHPRYAGELEQPTVTVEVTNPVCGDVLKVWLLLCGDRVSSATFKVAGCVPAIACGSWLVEWIQEKPVAELRPVSASQIEEALDGLPPASRHASALAAEALNQILSKLAHPRNRGK